MIERRNRKEKRSLNSLKEFIVDTKRIMMVASLKIREDKSYESV